MLRIIKRLKLNNGNTISQEVKTANDVDWNITYDYVDSYGNIAMLSGTIYSTQIDLNRQIPAQIKSQKLLGEGRDSI